MNDVKNLIRGWRSKTSLFLSDAENTSSLDWKYNWHFWGLGKIVQVENTKRNPTEARVNYFLPLKNTVSRKIIECIIVFYQFKHKNIFVGA